MRWILALLLVVGGTTLGGAQHEVRSALSLVSGIPQKTFGDQTDQIALGVAGSIGGRVPNLPLVLSTEVGALNQGHDAHLEIARLEDNLEDADFSVPVSMLGVETSSNILLGHLVARLQPQSVRVAPYLDALLGAKYFYTTTVVENEVAFSRELLFRKRFEDLALSYGAGAGLEVGLYKGPLGWSNSQASVLLDIGARYLFGSSAQYLAENAVRMEGDQILFPVKSSRTNMLMPYLGLRFRP